MNLVSVSVAATEAGLILEEAVDRAVCCLDWVLLVDGGADDTDAPDNEDDEAVVGWLFFFAVVAFDVVEVAPDDDCPVLGVLLEADLYPKKI